MQDISEFNISFVKLIEQQPCLYDTTAEDYYRGYVQEKAWETIAQAIGSNVTVKECKARWRNLRGRFTKHLRTHPAESHKRPYYLAEHLSFLLPFTKSKKLQPEETPFLEDSISRFLEIASSVSDQIGDELEPNEEIEFKYQFREPSETDKSERFGHGSGSPNKRNHPGNSGSSQLREKYRRLDDTEEFPDGKNISHHVQNTVDYSDSDLLFLMSLLPDLKRMDDCQKRKFKIGVLQMGGDILYESTTSSFPRRNSSTSNMSPDSGLSRTNQGNVKTQAIAELNENSRSN